jgi:hypothetical protein
MDHAILHGKPFGIPLVIWQGVTDFKTLENNIFVICFKGIDRNQLQKSYSVTVYKHAWDRYELEFLVL